MSKLNSKKLIYLVLMIFIMINLIYYKWKNNLLIYVKKEN